MALNAATLGQAIYDARKQFNELAPEAITSQYGDMEAYRLAVAGAEAKAIIDHITSAAEGRYQSGLIAGAYTVTAPVPTAAVITIH